LNDLADFTNAQAFNAQHDGRIFSEQIGAAVETQTPSDVTTGKESIMSRIEDKVVAITGASSGIGQATALLLAERGAKVVLGARG
jgi:NADPH:quinone reductase-like Zn-dependent oxidoreductase